MSHASRVARLLASGFPMRASLSVALLVLLGVGLLAGCTSVPVNEDGAIVDVDADSVIVHGAAAKAPATPEGKPYEYRAVCLESSKHPQAVYVMSKWLEDPLVATDLGNYHGNHKPKGHHWVIQRRVKH